MTYQNPRLRRPWWRQRMLVKLITLAVTTTTSTGITPSLAMPPHERLADRIARGDIKVPSTALEADLSRDQDLGRAPRAPRLPVGAAAVSFRTLAILIEYSDEPASVDPADFDTLLYELGTGSVRDFYLENSYGQLDLVTVHLPSATGWQPAPETGTYYANGEYGLGSGSYPNNAKKLVEDAIAAADPAVDFSQYDNDSDGWLDALMIIHTGPGAEFSGNPNDIWSHKWGISAQKRDGVWISSYAMMPEYWSSPGDITIGVFAHELGHVFGLPDLYDTDGSSRGLGRWSVMANGAWNGSLGNSPAHFDAWCKTQMGFCTPVEPTTQVSAAQFPQVETDSVIYKLWDNGAAGDEYFLVENRQRVGFDAGLPSAGLLIWHCDRGVTSGNRNEWYPGHTTSGHYLVALEQADGNWDLERSQDNGDTGDPFPGSALKRTFNSTTTPNSLAYDSSVSFVTLSNISDSDSLMTADLTVSLTLGVEDDGIRPHAADPVRNFPNPFNAQTRIEVQVAQAGPARLEIFNVLGERVAVRESPFVPAGIWTVDWDGRNSDGRMQSSGVYWYRATTGGQTARGKMLMLK